MRNLQYALVIFLIPLFSSGQNELNLTQATDSSVSVYVFGKSKVTLNGEKTSIPKLEKYLRTNQIAQAKIGTLKPTPMKVFPTFEKVVKLMEKYNIEAVWYRDPNFQKPFFDD